MKFSSLRPGAGAVLLCSISQMVFAQDTGGAYELAPIIVRLSQATTGASRYEFSPQKVWHAPAGDGGALLSSVPGVSLNRMGGHGLDLVVRGQQGNQLNVIDAGSMTFGGCPNRMDPPTSTMSFLQADRIIVERGYASVTNGPGGSGGAVILERDAPGFETGKRLSGTFVTGGASNSASREIAGTLAYDLGSGFYIEAAADAKTANDYQDGSGRNERSSYTQRHQSLTFGYAADGVELALDIEQDRAEDVLFAGAGMDSPLSEGRTYRLRGGFDVDLGALKRVETTLYQSNVDHVMDNYTLRAVSGMLMRVPSTSDTMGGKIEGQFEFGRTTAKVGIDLQSNARTAIAYGGMAGMRAKIDASDPTVSRFLMWPDVTIAQMGIYGETDTALSDRTKLTLGLRYDHVRASAGAAAGLAGYSATVPDQLYSAVYGATFDSARTEDNLGGLARLEHEISTDTTLFAGLSRSVRTADANERAMARGTALAPVWVGNPDIRPERHTQVDIGVETERDDWFLAATAYVDRVDDYILRDEFTTVGLTQYRNVSANLSGVEMSGSWSRGGWELSGDLTYTRGQNTTDDRPLAQIPPLQGRVSASYGVDAWRGGARVNWAQDQDRIDPARDPGMTPGYATLDLFGSYEINQTTYLIAGVDNAFDRTYANHLSRSNSFDTSVTQVMEPGRTLYLKLEAKF